MNSAALSELQQNHKSLKNFKIYPSSKTKLNEKQISPHSSSQDDLWVGMGTSCGLKVALRVAFQMQLKVAFETGKKVNCFLQMNLGTK